MGASSWIYFVPYQPDINAALQSLREKVFESGAYWLRVPIHLVPGEDGGWDLEAMRARVAEERRKAGLPRSIEELLLRNEDDGTHSILDIESVSDTPDFGRAASLTREELLDLFDTDKPTHSLIEESLDRVRRSRLRRRWEGSYVIIYKSGEPDEIFFFGYSGD